MDDFPTRVRAALAAQGMSMRRAANALNYDVAYLSRVLSGKQTQSPQLADAIDKLLGANGELQALAMKARVPARPDERPGLDADIAHMKESAWHLLEHADRYGGDTVASAAVQVWRSAQRKLDAGSIPEKEQRPYLSAVAESAEVAGWLLFDAGERTAARTAFLESHMLAKYAGDRAMKWFALDMLAMLDVESARPGEALRIAEAVLCEPRVPSRVALIARVRRGRALAQMGEHQRSTADLAAAKGGLEESLSHVDPGWTWWIDSAEVAGHSGQALLSVGHPGEAISELKYALKYATPRGVLLYRIDLLRGYASVRAWREAEQELEEIARLLHIISSGRNRLLLQEALHLIERDQSTPAWFSSLAKEVQENAA